MDQQDSPERVGKPNAAAAGGRLGAEQKPGIRLPTLKGAPSPGGGSGSGPGSPAGRAIPATDSPSRHSRQLPPLQSPSAAVKQGPGVPGSPGAFFGSVRDAPSSLQRMMESIEPDFRNRIATGMDVVEYFSSHGHAACIKLFYCVRADLSGTDCPYELVVIPKEVIRGDYYTISAAGVVIMYDDGSPSEFTPLGEWVREHSVFNMMKKFKFFRTYMALRMLRQWRNTARQQAFLRVRKTLESRLFVAKPDFCYALVDFHAKLSDMKATKLIDAGATGAPATLEEFMREQEETRTQKAMPAIEQVVAGMERSLARLVADVQKAEDNLAKEVTELEEKTSPSHVIQVNSPGTKGGNRSIVRLKSDKLEKTKAWRQAQADVSLLPNLVRLADYMLSEGALELLVGSVSDFRATMDVRPVIRVQLSFADTGLQLRAGEDEVRDALSGSMVDELIHAVRKFPRLLPREAFVHLFSAPVKGNDMAQLLVGYKPLNKARLGCGQAIAKSYRDAHEAVERYEELRAVNDFVTSFDRVAYTRDERNLTQFRRDFLLLSSWMGDLDALQSGESVGMLHVSCTELQHLLTGTLHDALEALRMLLTTAAHKEVVRALELFGSLTTSLSARPDSLDAFAAYYSEYTGALEGAGGLDERRTVALAMFEMLGSCGAKVPHADLVVIDDLKEVVATHARAMADAARFVDERKPTMVVLLDKEVASTLAKTADVISELRSGAFDSPTASTATVLEHIAATQAACDVVSERAARYKGYGDLFGGLPTNYGDVDQAIKELSVHRLKWEQLAEFEAASEGWMTGGVGSLSPDEIQAKVDELTRANYKAVKSRKDDAVVLKLKERIEAFTAYLPLLAEVANPALESRHWSAIFGILVQPFEDGVTTFCARDLIGFDIMGNFEAVQAQGAIATKEYGMLKTMQKMEAEWDGLQFKCMPYKDSGTFIIGGTDEIQTILDDQIVKIQAMNASPFVKPFKDKATAWEAMLQTLQDMLDNWLQCQSTWLYLEPIFSSADIVKQMPEEGEKFRQVDLMWREMMGATAVAPDVVPIASEKERVDKLVECNMLLEAIQKGLAAYLEKKRLFFPRFFFLSNDEMLEILSETKDPTRVQPHLKKCFEGVNTLTITEDLVITHMSSVEKEAVQFKHVVDTHKARGAVEKWLLEVEAGMFDSIHQVTEQGIADYATKERHDWVLQWPGMVVLVVTAIYWTRGVTDALKANMAAAYEKQCTGDLLKIVDLVRGELTGLQRATLGALVVMDVHARDVVAQLVKKEITSDTDFEWQAQLRSYWEEDPEGERDHTVMMRMMSACIQYGYEYLGNSSRLVITPLTDRCYRTLMGAIHLTLGGAPEGPAGTGKTETTKDLAKALARQCVVFNCSDSLDYLAMAKFFKGLASSGAWACFDEFNRINLEVLSVVAQQVLDIQRAIHARLKVFTFEGTEMMLKWSAWCAITMNPGYAGRSELPDNLKALFRTVAMMVPDYGMISEIMLYSNGYLAARECAGKIVATYKLCSEQLSSQDHYDYGMRAVIAVLRAAGNLKRRFPSEDEFVLMLRSIIDVNLCKFLSHDVPLFNGIISDLFPGVVLPKADYVAMEAAMTDACAANNLQPTPYFFEKTIQLYEMIVVRHGLMIVGLPFAGKTTSYRVLAQALTLMEDRGQEGQLKAEHHVINPKSITMGQLYGQADPVSNEWNDGILAVTFRALATNPAPHRKWLVMDGPVDAIWIENMNTVLDDNKKLCLNSGEIISMSASMNMIFEVADLAVASPATVSRCGMVYLEPHQLGWRPLVLSWLATLPAHMDAADRAHLLGLFDWLVPVSLRFVRRDVREGAPTLDAQLVTSLMRNFSALTPHFADAAQYAGLEARARLHIESIFIFSLVWSLGISCATLADRSAFDAFVRAAVGCRLSGYVSPSGELYTLPEDVPLGHGELTSPMMPDDAASSVYDYKFDARAERWVTWADMIEAAPPPAGATFRKVIIPTVDTVRYTFLLDKMVSAGQPLLVVGPTGTGKSVMVQKYLYGLPGDEYVPPNIVGFSARTSANQTQYLIDAKLDRRRKGVFGPPMGKRAVIFVDDLNMPTLETYGAQPPIELLRQFMDHGGWYDRTNTFRNMANCLFVAAMGPPGGGRNNVSSRYTRHFNMVSIVDFEDATLTRIFSSILDWALVGGGFPASIREMRDSVVGATMDVYKQVMGSLLPTPTKSHYTFNLRDISRVMQGFLMMSPAALGAGSAGTDKYLRLWTHEILRVFYDRLVDIKDRAWFLDFLKGTLHTRFGADFDKLFKHLLGDSGAATVSVEHVRSLFFGAYMDAGEDVEPAQRAYDELTDVPAVMARMEEYLSDHNAASKRPMNLAVFLYAVEHVSRAARVLKQPGAHLMAVGVGGSGRQSLSRLAAFISDMQIFQIEISKSYTQLEWREDVKRITRTAGADGKPCVFLFSDSQIKLESFVEDINNLLNSGEVPNMFPYDERAAVLEQCRGTSKREGLDLESAVELWNYFIEKTRENLHLMLCFSPIGDAFRERLRMFPSLVNCCTIDWFSEWPNDALEAVALKFLKDVDVELKQRTNIMAMCKTFHESVRQLSAQYIKEAGRINYVTPTSYLELITAFTTLLASKRSEVMAAKKRYEVGLEKLQFTAEQVVLMQNELTALKPNLIRTVAETEVLMATVAKEKVEVVEPKKAIVDADVKRAEESAAAANAIKTECEDALAEAIPILNSAIAALDTIKAADIKLVQSFKNPPGAIKVVMEAVCVLLEVKPARVKDPGGSGKMIEDYWSSAQKVLADPGFINSLKTYDKDKVKPAVIDKIRKEYTINPDFTPANAAKASSAAEGLCKWVCAMESYEKVAKVVAPKKAKLAEAEAEYNEVMEALHGKQAELKEVVDRLAKLEAQLETSMADKLRLESEVEICSQKLERAEKLITGLGGEKARWTEAAALLGVKYVNLTGDMLVSAGVISYLGAFTMAYRDQVVSKWVGALEAMGIPRSGKFSLNAALGDPVKIREWGIAGLPNDSFSIDNGIMVANARRWPLMIDPQTQANKWVKRMEAGSDLRVIKLTDGDFMRTLENAIQFGIPVLLENVGEELDPSLEPLLLKQLFKQGGVNYIRLGDATIEFADAFRFYITTALRNPHYLPETAVKVNLLNFMITLDGLSDQLLGVTVAQERPDLEEQRQALVVNSATNKKKLKEIEDKILHVLSSSQGNILEDASAIQILGDAKVVSNEIQEKEVVAEQTQREIDAARTGYKPGGAYNAILFFCIRDMGGIDPMYQYSLAWFISLYVRSIQASEKTDDLSQRLVFINDHFTYALYQNICRSLFEKDKLLFAFLLTTRIMLGQGKLEPAAQSFLLTGGVGVAEKLVAQPAGHEWLSAKAWGEVCRASNVCAPLSGLADHIAQHADQWKALFDTVSPDTAPLPGEFSASLSPFEKLMVLRCLRPDKLVPGIQAFVSASIGPRFTEPPPFDLAGSYRESSCMAPLLFVLSTGSDPTAALLQFADKLGYGNKTSVISMGQGQGPKAAALIATARKAGSWVLLQNCHLAPSWMPALEKICESIKPDNTDADFRLWMTSMPSPDFPVSILQGGVKMTNEPPAGLRANLRRSYALDPISSPEFFEGCTKPAAFKGLLFGLCFMHAFVQERRKFGPIGWNIPYGFDDGDLRISVRQLCMYINENEAVPFEALKYAIGECNYGGRVTDDKDRRLLNTILSRTYRPEILTDASFKLSASGTYVVPPEGTHVSYLSALDALPAFPLPEAFGLHDNADITKDLAQTQEMLETLIMTGGGSGGNGGGGEEDVVASMVADMLSRLPPNFDIEKAMHKYPVRYDESLNQVLCQEMLRYNRLLSIIRESLVYLDKALQGLQVMSSELDAVFKSMAIGHVPTLWKGKSFPSLKPLASYTLDLLQRLKMLSDWYDVGAPPVFWIPGFFFTPSFMTGALQNYARKHKLPIDKVGYDFVMMGMDPTSYPKGPEDGIYIKGFFLEGCAWDAERKLLRESTPKVLFEPAPVIWLQPKPIDQFSQYQAYECPVYRTAERKGVLATTGHSTNFLMMVRMPTDSPEYHWVNRGVCMLCSLSD